MSSSSQPPFTGYFESKWVSDREEHHVVNEKAFLNSSHLYRSECRRKSRFLLSNQTSRQHLSKVKAATTSTVSKHKSADSKGFHQVFFTENDSTCTSDDSEDESSRHNESSAKSTSTRAIPIPHPGGNARKVRGKEEDFENEESIKQAERHYELATWGMYDRIVDYRARNPIGLAYSHESIFLQTQKGTTTSYKRSFVSTQNPKVAYYEIDDGIFDMEIWSTYCEFIIDTSWRFHSILLSRYIQQNPH